MDWLYRIFYTVFSMGVLMVLLLPIVAAVRFLLRNYKKKYTVWAWWIFFLRSICPVALSSALCIVPGWNRKYHQFLSNLGLTVQDGRGIMRSWRAVFENEIEVTGTFKITGIIWAAGVAGALLFSVFNLRKLKSDLQAAGVLGEHIYENKYLAVPISLGFSGREIYLPEGFQTAEMTWFLQHMENHRREGLSRLLVLLIMAVHWFNPVMWLYYYWWCNDMEMADDDRTVQGKKEAERNAYAQGLINFKREPKGVLQNMGITGGPFFIGIRERNIQKRAYRMMYQKAGKANAGLSAVLLLSLLAVFSFLLRPMQIAWSGGTWGKGRQPSEEAQALFEKKENNLIAKMGTMSPEGLNRTIQLEMLDGTEEKNGYRGSFVLRMYDTVGNELASLRISMVFPDIETGQQYFSKGLALCINDYNGDGTQELVIGQQAENTMETEYDTFTYALINIGDKSLDILNSDIVAAGTGSAMGESIPFEKPEGIEDIFIVPNGEIKQYYVWNARIYAYEQREMTEEDLAAHREGTADGQYTGELQEHTLEDSDGKTAVLVSARPDSTQSEEIQSVILEPRGASKRFQDVQGYYCDLLWAEDEDDEERYAQLIYNGTKAQTFVLYDTKRKRVYYQHEDGTNQLAQVFAQFQEQEITFGEEGTVLYSLKGKKEDVLTISFVADAEGGITVSGRYEYDAVKKEARNLMFERRENTTAE